MSQSIPQRLRAHSKLLSRLSGLFSATLITAGLCCARTTSGTPEGSISSKKLPTPTMSASPLLQLLQKRHTSREFAARPLDAQVTSNLLWAAFGVNRSDGERTAPSAHNWQYVDIYATDSEGLYRFDAKNQALELIKPGDIRKLTGIQGFAASAPLTLVYVFDERRVLDKGLDPETKILYGATTVGAIVQNVYLFCAASNLNTGVRSDIERAALHKAMGLANEQKVLLAQSIGYPTSVANVKQGVKGMPSR